MSRRLDERDALRDGRFEFRREFSKPARSLAESFPRPNTRSTPFFPSRTFDAKKGSLVTSLATYAHSTTPRSPDIARRHADANCAAAAAIDSVAEPAPSFASTTSVPPF